LFISRSFISGTVAPVYIVPDFSSSGWSLRQSIELLKDFDVTEVAYNFFRIVIYIQVYWINKNCIIGSWFNR